MVDAGRLGQEREFGGLRLGEFEAALVRRPVIGWLGHPIGPRLMMSHPFSSPKWQELFRAVCSATTLGRQNVRFGTSRASLGRARGDMIY